VKIQSVNRKEVDQAQLYILNNTVEMIPYISQHIDEIKFAHLRISEKWALNEHNKAFLSWFKKKIYAIPNVSETLLSYIKIIQEGWEVDYVTFRVLVFKCKWVDNNSGVGTDDLSFTLMDLNKMSYMDEPFIMASQARQIFYVINPTNQKWSIVLEGRSMHGNNDEDCLDLLEMMSFSSTTIQDKVDDVIDYIHTIRSDHNEGIWEKIIPY